MDPIAVPPGSPSWQQVIIYLIASLPGIIGLIYGLKGRQEAKVAVGEAKAANETAVKTGEDAKVAMEEVHNIVNSNLERVEKKADDATNELAAIKAATPQPVTIVDQKETIPVKEGD